MESLLLPGILPDHVHGALHKETLLATLELQQRIESSLNEGPKDILECLKDADSGDCFVIGPLIKWHDDLATLFSDPNVILTMNTAQNISKAGVPIGNELIMGGRGPADDKGFIYETEFLVVSYFFVEHDCHTNAKHTAWTQVVRDSVNGYGSVSPSQGPTSLIALQVSVHSASQWNTAADLWTLSTTWNNQSTATSHSSPSPCISATSSSSFTSPALCEGSTRFTLALVWHSLGSWRLLQVRSLA